MGTLLRVAGGAGERHPDPEWPAMSADRRIGTLLAWRARGELPLPDWEDELQLVHCEEILEQLDHGYLDADHCEHVAMIISEHYSLPARAESPQLRAHQMAAYVVQEAEGGERRISPRDRRATAPKRCASPAAPPLRREGDRARQSLFPRPSLRCE